MDAVSLLEKLVSIESPSGKEDEIAEFISSYLKKIGLRVSKENNNIVLNADADFWIITHMDTVPMKAKFRYDGMFAYGTGVCDAKGSITAVLIALEKLKEIEFGVAFLSDEEETGSSSAYFAKEHRGSAIVMEPTSLKIATRHYGTLEVNVKVKGKPAHGAMPECGENAIEKAIEMLEKLKELHNFTVLKINGGSDEYVIPDICDVRIDFLLKPDENLHNLKKKVIDLASVYGDVDVIEEAEGFISSEGKAKSVLEYAMKTVGIEVDYAEMPAWTDAVNLRKEGWDVVVWGPGELAHCHTRIERVPIYEIECASRVIIAINGVLSSLNF